MRHSLFTYSSVSNLTILACNVVSCILVGVAVYVACAWTSFPMTIDVLWQLMVTEISLRRSTREVAEYCKENAEKGEDEKSALFEKSLYHNGPIVDTLSTVVGWREEEDLFEACIRSYKAAEGCRFLIVGVDGDEAEDMSMVDIYQKVYPDSSLVVHFDLPLGDILQSYSSDSLNNAFLLAEKHGSHESDALQMLCHHVRNILYEQSLPDSLASIQHICIYQPHRSKKDILFSAFIVGLVVGEELGIDYIWGSDSDSVVFVDTLQTTARLVRCDPSAGGASTRLHIVNKNSNAVAKMIAAKYWYDQDVVRAQTAACKASECQPGPCAMFRTAALREVVVPWYEQKIFGKRIITNEDRHLTTNLLHKGWKVHYAPNASVLTDAPTTSLQWIKQQVRWGRGTHIERLAQPIIYVRKCPIFFLHVWKEEIIPLIVAYNVIQYLLSGSMLLGISWADVGTRILVQFMYTVLRSCEPVTLDHAIWIVPSLFFYALPGPGIHLWSLVTAFESSWGTKMRGTVGTIRKENIRGRWYQAGFFVIWMTILVGFYARILKSQINVYIGEILRTYLVPGSMLVTGPMIYWSIFSDLHKNQN